MTWNAKEMCLYYATDISCLGKQYLMGNQTALQSLILNENIHLKCNLTLTLRVINRKYESQNKQNTRGGKYKK